MHETRKGAQSYLDARTFPGRPGSRSSNLGRTIPNYIRRLSITRINRVLTFPLMHSGKVRRTGGDRRPDPGAIHGAQSLGVRARHERSSPGRIGGTDTSFLSAGSGAFAEENSSCAREHQAFRETA